MMTEKWLSKWIAGGCYSHGPADRPGLFQQRWTRHPLQGDGQGHVQGCTPGEGIDQLHLPRIPRAATEVPSATSSTAIYSLTTQTPGDGAFPGKYRVAISSKEAVSDAAIEEEMKKAFAKKGISPGSMPSMPKGGGNMGAEFAFKARKTAKSLIPEKFATARTSNLTAEVKAQSNTIDFPLGD